MIPLNTMKDFFSAWMESETNPERKAKITDLINELDDLGKLKVKINKK